MSKHAILSFSECLYLEMAHAAPDIRVSAVVPGAVATRIFTVAQMSGDKQKVQHHQAAMEQVLRTYGMPANEAGELILYQIAEGRFWVTTDPEMLTRCASQRAAHLEGLEKPAVIGMLGR
jgi:short-subunit dehydrogenase